MVKTKKAHRKDSFKITLRSRNIEVLLDKVLFFRIMNRLHGRFWGLMFIFVVLAGSSICFLIRPDLFSASTALSNFGEDVRTSPYFAGTMFFSAYCLWRWRNHLARTLKRARPTTALVTMTIFGFYLIALMPVSWKPWPYRIHNTGVMIVGLSMIATVVSDGLLTKSTKSRFSLRWRTIRLLSVILLITGLVFTATSSRSIAIYHISLIGEGLIVAGYSFWIIAKTFQREGGDSRLAKLIRKLVIIQ